MGLSYYHISRDAGGCSDEIAPQDWHAFSKYPQNIYKQIFEKSRIISKSLLFLLETKLAIIKLFSDNNFLQAITEQLKLVFRCDSKLIFKNWKLWTYLWYPMSTFWIMLSSVHFICCSCDKAHNCRLYPVHWHLEKHKHTGFNFLFNFGKMLHTGVKLYWLQVAGKCFLSVTSLELCKKKQE